MRGSPAQASRRRACRPSPAAGASPSTAAWAAEAWAARCACHCCWLAGSGARSRGRSAISCGVQGGGRGGKQGRVCGSGKRQREVASGWSLGWVGQILRGAAGCAGQQHAQRRGCPEGGQALTACSRSAAAPRNPRRALLQQSGAIVDPPRARPTSSTFLGVGPTHAQPPASFPSSGAERRSGSHATLAPPPHQLHVLGVGPALGAVRQALRRHAARLLAAVHVCAGGRARRRRGRGAGGAADRAGRRGPTARCERCPQAAELRACLPRPPPPACAFARPHAPDCNARLPTSPPALALSEGPPALGSVQGRRGRESGEWSGACCHMACAQRWRQRHPCE